MSAILRAKNNESFMNDVKAAFGEGYLQRTSIFGFLIGPKEVNTSKVTNEIAKKTIAHAAIRPTQSSNFYKRAFTVCAATAAVVAFAYFGRNMLVDALTLKSTNNEFLLN